MNRLNETFNKQNYKKIKKIKTITFKENICFDNDLLIETTS